MAQFDLYRLAGEQLIVDLQTDLISIDTSRIVAPLREAGRYVAFPELTPRVEVEGPAGSSGFGSLQQCRGRSCDSP